MARDPHRRELVTSDNVRRGRNDGAKSAPGAPVPVWISVVQLPGFTDALKYAVVAGAVKGGDLTVIANTPSPAGQNILQRFFPDGVGPLGWALGARPPTILTVACFLLL